MALIAAFFLALIGLCLAGVGALAIFAVLFGSFLQYLREVQEGT